jgi:hypothetical protein
MSVLLLVRINESILAALTTCWTCAAQVMKMFMPMLAPAAGTLRWRLPEGSILAPGDLIATLDLTDHGAVTQAEPFTGAGRRLQTCLQSWSHFSLNLLAPGRSCSM